MKIEVGKEEWKPIEGYEGLYEVSNMGKVRNKQKRVLKPQDNGRGYMKILLCNGISQKRFYVHRLVAQAFVPNPMNVNVVNHLDECPSNNRADNLEWTTQKGNVHYGNAIQKMTECSRNYWKTHTSTRRKPVRCIDTGEVFASVAEAANAKGTYGGNIAKCIQGLRGDAGGYHWEYYEVKK